MFYDGSAFLLRNSRNKKSFSLSRPLIAGDVVTVLVDLIGSLIELRVTGEGGLNVSKKFGMALGVSDPGAYLAGVSIGPGQSVALREIDLPSVIGPIDDTASDLILAASLPLPPVVVKQITAGCRVRIKPVSVEEARLRQESHGGWSSSMAGCLGEIGTTEVARTGIWRVRMLATSDNFAWNAELLEVVEKSGMSDEVVSF